MSTSSPLDSVREHLAAGEPREALRDALRAWDVEPENPAIKHLIARTLRRYPTAATPEQAGQVHRLLKDPRVSPEDVSAAGWHLARQTHALFATDDAATMARHLEGDDFARDLLHETYVNDLDAETKLTALRRWLLLSRRWQDFPRSTVALVTQAQHNAGAWLFDDEERARLGAEPDSLFAKAYGTGSVSRRANENLGHATTTAVAEQYENWPYPAWTRITWQAPKSLVDDVKAIDPDGPDLPDAPQILIAGCGTGREAALVASKYPSATITAIDLSETSLAYGRARRAELGLSRISFRQLDLHRAGELGVRFDAIFASGVLHHLPDPEAGWAALAKTLAPSGVMKVMLYSSLARLRIRAARSFIADFADRPISADLLRAVRARLMATPQKYGVGSRDFFTLGGVHDLLLHSHEDPFTVTRIGRALKTLGMKLVRFELPNDAEQALYRESHPNDPMFRNMDAWAALEKDNPFLFGGMYDFWCRKI
jgi:SAM-dependent methyltransferase